MSDIRVSVTWKTSTIFAGEDIECDITFKNVSTSRRSPSPRSHSYCHGSTRERWREKLPLRTVQASVDLGHGTQPLVSRTLQPHIKTHSPALSLSTLHDFQPAPSSKALHGMTGLHKSADVKHRRSVSIVSIAGNLIDEVPSPDPVSTSGKRVRGHARAASFQVLPHRTHNSKHGPLALSGHSRTFTAPSPLIRSSSSLAEQQTSTEGTSQNPSSSFKFPSGPDNPEKGLEHSSRLNSKAQHEPSRRNLSPRPYESLNSSEPFKQPTRILSPANFNGTPRSSGEFYSMSNNSTETLASEYIIPENTRSKHRSAPSRRGSRLTSSIPSRPETLMMGYAQIAGSFTLDGSLVNQGPFEEAKRKGIIGGQGGGGVVRNELTKRDSGLLGSLGWGQIGESLGGLLGGSETSSIKESKSITNSRSIPILSAPQSILFVDLRLGPGESRSYTYRHPLPRGVPPTHRGRAIRTSYSLIIGTQRVAKSAQQHAVRHAEFPFRVLTGVNDHGEVLGHDLMAPHTILSNVASISTIDNTCHLRAKPKEADLVNLSRSSSTDFLSYIDKVLERPHQSPGASIISPTEQPGRQVSVRTGDSCTMKDSIDLAILRSNTVTSSKRSANRFEIARSGDRVAVIILARPAYRLGETIPVAIDLQDSSIQCYSLHATLETSEIIDPAIALRSQASIHRVTKRTHASHSESIVAARRVIFSPVIPLNSTPDFITSGVSLEWRLRFEFVTGRVSGTGESDEVLDDLLEEVARDERGSVSAAVQGLTCETFDVTVPLRVYGAGAGFDEKTSADEIPI